MAQKLSSAIKSKVRRAPAPPAPPAAAALPPMPESGLGEEERIESAKYLAREMPPRVFEEERFLFPQSYGVSRLRLLIKDPYWLFAYWDVDAGSIQEVRRSLGERTAALSRLTLRISDPKHGGTRVILVPTDARSWYVQVDAEHRSYKAELGLTLPSGDFRSLCESNVVTPPRVGPAARGAGRRISWKTLLAGRTTAALEAQAPEPGATGPWDAPPPVEGASGEARETGTGPGGEASETPGTSTGGASDSFRPTAAEGRAVSSSSASAKNPGGASDTFRR